MFYKRFQGCLAAFSECAIECAQCKNDCLEEIEINNLIRCIKLTDDCASLCIISVQSIISGAEFANQICNLCAEVCSSCAEECEKHPELEHCVKCAAICRRCEVECKNLD